MGTKIYSNTAEKAQAAGRKINDFPMDISVVVQTNRV